VADGGQELRFDLQSVFDARIILLDPSHLLQTLLVAEIELQRNVPDEVDHEEDREEFHPDGRAERRQIPKDIEQCDVEKRATVDCQTQKQDSDNLAVIHRGEDRRRKQEEKRHEMPGRCLLNRDIDHKGHDRNRAQGGIEDNSLEDLPPDDRVLAILGLRLPCVERVEKFGKNDDRVVGQDRHGVEIDGGEHGRGEEASLPFPSQPIGQDDVILDSLLATVRAEPVGPCRPRHTKVLHVYL